MPTQVERAQAFRALHQPGDPVVLFNIWDPGSAKVVEAAGAKALATGSAPVAMAQNYADGEQIPMASALANAERIAALTELPVTLDFEGAYAADPEGIAENTRLAIAAGVVGFNFEDQVVGTAELYDTAVQVQRIRAMKSGMAASGVDAFLNSRTDIFLKAARETHDAAMLDAAIARGLAYAEAGADGFFAPGLVSIELIAKLCEALPLPVNIIALPGCPPKSALADAGVSRISYGPVPYRKLMAALAADATEAFA